MCAGVTQPSLALALLGPALGSGVDPAQAGLAVPGPVLGLPTLRHSELSLLPVSPCSAVPGVPVAAHTPQDPSPGGRSLGQVGMAAVLLPLTDLLQQSAGGLVMLMLTLGQVHPPKLSHMNPFLSAVVPSQSSGERSHLQSPTSQDCA